jgi:TPR repeat protein
MRRAICSTILMVLFSAPAVGASVDLSSVPTADIVDEYKKRFSEQIIAINSVMQDFTSSNLERAYKYQLPRKLTDQEIIAVDELISAVTPYANIEDFDAQTLLVTTYQFRYENRPSSTGYDCKMLNMTFENAGRGSPVSARLLARFYMDGKVVPKDKQLSYFWAKEAARRTGKPSNTELMKFDFTPQAQLDQLNARWLLWSPSSAADEAVAKNPCQ